MDTPLDRNGRDPRYNLTPEEKAALEKIGVRFGTGEPLRDFRPVSQRPWWLAFLWRQFHRVFPEAED